LQQFYDDNDRSKVGVLCKVDSLDLENPYNCATARIWLMRTVA